MIPLVGLFSDQACENAHLKECASVSHVQPAAFVLCHIARVIVATVKNQSVMERWATHCHYIIALYPVL